MLAELLSCLILSLTASDADSVTDWTRRLDGLLAEKAETRTVLVVPDDWATGGTWTGRYGRFAWVLCGMSGPRDYTGGSGIGQIKYRAYLGENRAPDDGLRAWVHWPYLSDTVPEGFSPAEMEKSRGPLGKIAPAGMDPWDWPDLRRVLQNPVNRGRRQSSWDDLAEGYSPWFSSEGPHLYLDVELPAGQFLLSLYFVNKDAHWGAVNRFRDYVVQIKRTRDYGQGTGDRKGKTGNASQDGEHRTPNTELPKANQRANVTGRSEETGWEQQFDKAPVLAETRVQDFFGGVYKRFFVQGPARLTVRIHKGDSINTVLSGVFVDDWVKEETVDGMRKDKGQGTGDERGGSREPQKRNGPKGAASGQPDAVGPTSDPEAGELAKLSDRLLSLKRQSPVEFPAVSAELAGDAGLWAARRGESRELAYIDRLGALAALFDTLLEFEARDETWTRYGEELHDWVVGTQGPVFFERKKAFWQRCERAQSNPALTREQVEELHRQYFEGILSTKERPVALTEIRDFGRLRATTRPRLARAALEALKTYYRQFGINAPLSAFFPEELFAWAQCHRQLGDHLVAANHFERFIERFPKHPKAALAAQRLKAERRLAENELKLRNQEFEVAPAVGRPE